MRSVPILVAAMLIAACGESSEEPEQGSTRPAPEAPATEGKPELELAHCPPGAGNCRAASGRILYVERVDPDGDGDAHFVLLSRPGVTGPGITVVDVKRSLRRHPLPGPGDRLSAAGPVYKGSYGQRQIEATELQWARSGNRR